MAGKIPPAAQGPKLSTEVTIAKGKDELAQGLGTNILKLQAAKTGQRLTVFDEVYIKIRQEYVTIPQYLFGIFNGMLLGFAIISIIYAAIGFTIDLSTSNLSSPIGGVMIGMLLFGLFSGLIISSLFNRRATACATRNEDSRRRDSETGEYMNYGAKFAIRQGDACTSDWHCTNLDESEGQRGTNAYFNYVQGRCMPLQPPFWRIRFRQLLTFAALVGGVIELGINGTSITKTHPSSSLVSFFFGLLAGWIISLILS